MLRRFYFSLVVVLAFVCLSCDSVPLLAPTNSTVTIDAQSRVVSTGGTTEVTATVIESGGTPVHNGTLVRFTTTLGRMDPVEAQTRNGIAVSTFVAGADSGVAEVRATSGSAGGGSTTTTPPTTTPPTTPTTTTTAANSNVVLIAVGSGAVDTVTLRANPATVSTNGGTVTLIATVVAAGGRALPGISVSFSANRGTLSTSSAVTDANGEARVTLTTNADTSVTATAGSKTSTPATTIAAQAAAAVQLTCAVGGATNCATASTGQTVIFTAQRVQGSANLTSAVLDFGDNSSQNLGTLSAATTVPHTYSQPGTYTARLTGTDVNGESSTSIQVIQVSAVAGTVSAAITSGRTVSATATVSAPVTQYQWNWGDSTSSTTTSPTAQRTYTAAGTYTIVMTATLQAGGTLTASTTIDVP